MVAVLSPLLTQPQGRDVTIPAFVQVLHIYITDGNKITNTNKQIISCWTRINSSKPAAVS